LIIVRVYYFFEFFVFLYSVVKKFKRLVQKGNILSSFMKVLHWTALD
jgi:hypothetical protein